MKNLISLIKNKFKKEDKNICKHENRKLEFIFPISRNGELYYVKRYRCEDCGKEFNIYL